MLAGADIQHGQDVAAIFAPAVNEGSGIRRPGRVFAFDGKLSFPFAGGREDVDLKAVPGLSSEGNPFAVRRPIRFGGIGFAHGRERLRLATGDGDFAELTAFSFF